MFGGKSIMRIRKRPWPLVSEVEPGLISFIGGSAKEKRRTKITIETERLLVIRLRGQEAEARCAACNQQVKTIKPEEAAIVSGVTTRTIYR
jgi:hypothetical protein